MNIFIYIYLSICLFVCLSVYLLYSPSTMLNSQKLRFWWPLGPWSWGDFMHRVFSASLPLADGNPATWSQLAGGSMLLRCTLHQNAGENVAACSAPGSQRHQGQLATRCWTKWQSSSPAWALFGAGSLKLGRYVITGIDMGSWRTTSTLHETWSNPMFCTLSLKQWVFSVNWLGHSAPIFHQLPRRRIRRWLRRFIGDAGDVGSWAATRQLWMHAVRHHKNP